MQNQERDVSGIGNHKCIDSECESRKQGESNISKDQKGRWRQDHESLHRSQQEILNLFLKKPRKPLKGFVQCSTSFCI